VVPEDAGRPTTPAAPDDLIHGHDQVQPEVVGGLGEHPSHDLEGVDGGDEHGVPAEQPGLGQQAELQVGISSTLADPGTLAVDGDASADHQLHRAQLVHPCRPADPRRLAD
jgi:hypothetical protein